jgi:mycothione reductase
LSISRAVDPVTNDSSQYDTASSIKHSATHEARTVARTVLGDDPEPVDYTAMAFAVFASPEVAGVGATEGELREKSRDCARDTYR